MPVATDSVLSPAMPRRDLPAKTEQVNFRLRTSTLDRMDAYKERHPLKPTLTSIVEAAVNQWLDREEPALPPDPDVRPPSGGPKRQQR